MSKDWIIIIGLFILIGFAWSITGGPVRKYEIPTFNSGIETSIETAEEDDDETIISTLEDSSIYKGKITLEKGDSNIYKTKVEEEYIVIEAYRRNEEPINITGWEIRSLVSKSGYIIPKAVNTAKSGRSAVDVILNASDQAIVVTGRSPIGESFRTNICTGYFEQFQDFYPYLSKDCPYPENEIGSQTFNTECVEFLEDLPQCEMRIAQVPITLSSSCQGFVSTEINYNGCVDAHINDDDFYGTEWRLFLGRSQEIWQDRREIISLFDSEGNVVDTITY